MSDENNNENLEQESEEYRERYPISHISIGIHAMGAIVSLIVLIILVILFQNVTDNVDKLYLYLYYAVIAFSLFTVISSIKGLITYIKGSSHK